MSRWTTFLPMIAMLLIGNASAANFRTTSQIFEGGSQEPCSVIHVLFEDGIVFELPQIDKRFVTVYDPAQGLVTLLDRERQEQADLLIEDLVKMTAALRATADTPERKERIGLTAKVQKSTKGEGLTIRFGATEYQMTTQKPNDAALALEYGGFALMKSQLNVARRLGAPPFARMTLYEYVAVRKEVPQETTLTRQSKDVKTTYRSTLELGQLTEQDRQGIREVRGMMQFYKHVEKFSLFGR